ncbi:MAG: hypothetical protein ABIJ50_06570 [Pseudomonadota bacterium]
MATQIRQIEDEEAAIRGHIDQYRQLEVSGVIGDEERLKLVEVLGHIRAQYKFYPLQFDIGQQVVIPLREGSGEPWLSLRSSQIKFTLPLLHEEDLSRLLVELRNIGRGLFVVEECSLSRPGTEKQGDPVQLKENLNASCTLSWLTLKPEEKNPGAESVPSVSGGGV